MLHCEFIVDGPPVSAQAKSGPNKAAYRAKVAKAAKASWLLGTPLVTDVSVTITHFFEGAPADLDNISKLIIDGLKGVVSLTRGIGLKREFVHIAIATPPKNAELRSYDYP
jgi:hypothetical protein